MGNIFTKHDCMKKHDTDTIINIEISDNFKEISELIQNSNKQLPNLEEKNIRNVPVITKYQNYAPDIHVYYDYEKIKQDLKYFKLISTKNGFTSKVNIYE